MVVIAICGTPGTGKSSLAERFRRLGFKVIHLSKYVIDEKLYSNYDKRRDAYIIDEDKLMEAIRREASLSDKLVIEGIGAEILPKNLVDICIVLTCEPYVLEERLSKKGFSPQKIAENLEAERFGVILMEALNNYGRERTIILDTTYRDVDELFNVIMDELRKRRII